MLNDDRYYPTDDEMRILVPSMKKYYSFADRSIGRKNEIDESLKKLQLINPKHWNKTNVRIWFRNNKKQYIGSDVERVPTSQLPGIPTIDPNIDQNPILDYRDSLPSSKISFSDTSSFQKSLSKEFIIEDRLELPSLSPNWNECTESYQAALYDHYNFLISTRKLIKDSFATMSEETQKEIEYLYGKCLDQMRNEMKIKDINASDRSIKKIDSGFPPRTQRCLSVSTMVACQERIGTYNSVRKPRSPSLYSSENKKIPLNLPSDLEVLYKGVVEESSSTINDVQACVIDASGVFVYTFYDFSCQGYVLVYGTDRIATGFYGPSLSMIQDPDSKIIWIAADCRVKGFLSNPLRCVDTLSTGSKPLKYSTLAIWDNCIVLGIPDTILIWSKVPEKNEIGKPMKLSNNMYIPKTINLQSIDYESGRISYISYPLDIPNTKPYSIVCIHDYIIIGSKDYPTVHVMDTNGQICKRFVGHTNGISSLLKMESSIISGSLDFSIQEWNIADQKPVCQFIAHSKPVCALSSTYVSNFPILLSGGNDGIVYAWDLKNETAIFEVFKEKTHVISVSYIEKSKILVVVFEHEPNSMIMSPSKYEVIWVHFK